MQGRCKLKRGIHSLFCAYVPHKIQHVLVFVISVALFSGSAAQSVSNINTRSDSNGISVEFNLPELQVSTTEKNAIQYQSVSYDNCGFISDPGNPYLPVSRVVLGVPANASFSVEIVHATNETRLNHRLPPAPRRTLQHSVHASRHGAGSAESIQTAVEEWREDGLAYQTDSVYPTNLAEIIYDGYIRSQRVIYLELRPVQYVPQSRRLHLHSRIVVRIHFDLHDAVTLEPSLSPSLYYDSGIIRETDAFERTFRNLLLNYEEAKVWRVPRRRSPSAPAIQHPPPVVPDKVRYKILVDKTGIYRLTWADLRNEWGIDLREADVRNLHLRTGGKEVPMYIHGESDGSFDRGDYIDFLGLNPQDRYTQWNVYWLNLERRRGIRVSEIDATPDDPTATVVPVFRSRIHFEENLLTNNLEHVRPEDVSSNDKHAWFESLDFWYWDGIRNSSDYNEMELEFPLYDLARSFDQPTIELLLQGGTPRNHEILTSINGVRIDNATWRLQNTTSLEKTLRVWDNLKDATKGDSNILTLARVDTTEEDDTTRYPYHVYLNSFDVEYTRLLKAVNDYLEFSSPPSTTSYAVRKHRRLEYSIQTFLAPKVELFEYDGEHLVSKLKNPTISRVNLDLADRNRLSAIYRSQTSGKNKNNAGFRHDIPHVAYNATFQVPDTHDAQFIAVSSDGVRRPAKVEAVTPSGLLSMSNAADYIIITHPNFLEPSKRLANWRADERGGGFRTKVVDVTEIYDGFGDGRVNPRAIKDFLAYAYENWQPPALSYVVIMGDGTYDFLGVDKNLYPEPPEVMGYIPTHYIWTTSFGRTAADHWYATVSGLDELTDFYIGRLTVETMDHATGIVDKIINYESNRPNGSWRRHIISVADDEVNNSGDFIFKKSLNEIAQSHTLLGYETTEIFLEDIIDLVEANPDDFRGMLPQHVAKKRIVDALSEGAVLAQYAGHGGRIVWAHENIFGNVSVDLVEQTRHIPFMLVLSCYNGYFDAPGEPSMAEKLLRKAKGGIIGMLSATRLTYGSGNDALNRIIFDHLFQRNERELGALTFNSKIELLINHGVGSNIDVMMAYTLFADPAMQLAMADFEIQPKVKTTTVVPGGTIEISPGQILDVVYNARSKEKQFSPISHFNGPLQVKAIFPGKHATGTGKNGAVEFYTGDVVVTKESQVTNGKFPAFSILVPDNINSGPAHVEYYAEGPAHIAVGGTSLTVLEPKILDIQPETVNEDSFRISAQISDELSNTGIKEVTLTWRNPETRDWETVTMIPDQLRGIDWYTVPSPLLLAANGAAIRYDIQVVDIDDNVTISDLLSYRPVVFPNLKPVNTALNARESLIYYQYSADANSWTLNADIQQVENIELEDSVEVVFFAGNPDLNMDNVVDEEAWFLGQVEVSPDAWQRRDPLEPHKTLHSQNQTTDQPRAFRENPLNINWITTVTLTHELTIGDHKIFVWIDPVFDKKETPNGKVREGDEEDNLGQKEVQVRETLIGKTAKRAFSHDSVIDFRLSSDILPQPTVLTIREMSEQNQPQPIQQYNLTPVALPNGRNAVAYNVALAGGQTNSRLNQPMTSEIRFDLNALKREISDELFGKMPSTDDSLIEFDDFSREQVSAINEGAEQRAKEISAYLWVETLGKWTRVDSKLATAADGSIQVRPTIANVSPSNHGQGNLLDVRIAPTGTKRGRWVLLFTSATTYRVLVRKDGAPPTVISALRHIEFPQDPPNYRDGIAIDIDQAEPSFQFGDVLTFDVDQDSVDNTSPLYASSFLEENRGTGAIQYVRLSPNSSMPRDRWVILFVDSHHFQIEGQETGILLQNGQPIQGIVGKEFSYPEFGLTLKLAQGRWMFETGDSFRFETREVGRVRAEITMLGPLALMRSDDVIPPDIQMAVAKQSFADGDPVSSEPLIQATLTDNNGIDYITRSIRLEIRKGSDFILIPETEYRLSHRTGSNQVALNYHSPPLQSGSYQLRLTTSDVDGNESEKELEFRVHKILQLLKALNYPNPFTSDTTITCELTGVADEISVKVYSLSGRLVREFTEDASAGFNMIPWDGRDRDGNEVANGVYYCKICVRKEGEKNLIEYLKMMKLK